MIRYGIGVFQSCKTPAPSVRRNKFEIKENEETGETGEEWLFDSVYGRVELEDLYTVVREYFAYPGWFMEGVASLIAGRYASEKEYLTDYGIADLAGTTPSNTAHSIAEAFANYSQGTLNTEKLEDSYLLGESAAYDFGPAAATLSAFVVFCLVKNRKR